jgi:hypothetical protein
MATVAAYHCNAGYRLAREMLKASNRDYSAAATRQMGWALARIRAGIKKYDELGLEFWKQFTDAHLGQRKTIATHGLHQPRTVPRPGIVGCRDRAVQGIH